MKGNPKMHGKRQMFRSSMVVGIFSFLGSFTGILVEISIAARLGLSKSSDTFYAAYTIPYIITNLLSATGQFSLVPFFSSLEARHSTQDLWRGFSYAVNVVFLGLAGVAGIGALTARWLIRGIAPGFTPAETALASELCRWLFAILLPAGLAEAIRSFLLSQHRFVIPASASFFRNVTVIASILVTFNRFGFYSIVFGYIAGYLIQLGVLGAQLFISFPVRYSLTLAGSGEAFQNLRGAGAAQIMAALAWQAVVVVERIIASFLPPGTLTALAYGFKVVSTLAEVLAGSVGTASLPTLSRAFARRAVEEERGAFRNAIEIGVLLVAPAAVFCLMLPRNIIWLVFQHGKFNPAAAALMTLVFFYYSLTLLPFAARRMLTFYLFSRNEGAVHLRLALLQYGMIISLDVLYVGVLGWGAAGIPLGHLTSLVITLGVAYARNLGSIKQSMDRTLGGYFLKVLVGSVLAGLLVLAMRAGIAPPQTNFENFVYLCETCAAGTLVFFAALLVLRALKLSQITSLWETG